MEFGWDKEPVKTQFFDGGPAVITNAYFQESSYGGVQLVLELVPLDGDFAGTKLPPRYYSAGKGEWVILDGGKTISGPQFREGTKIALLVKAAQESGFSPKGASTEVWIGQAFEWATKTMSEVAGREIKIQGVEPIILVPVKYLGKREVTSEGMVIGAEKEEADSDELTSRFYDAVINTLKSGQKTWPLLLSGILKTLDQTDPLRAFIIEKGQATISEFVEEGLVNFDGRNYSLP